MRGIHGRGIWALAALAVGSALLGGCGSKDIRSEVVASADGEEIRVRELREFLGAPGGGLALKDIPVEKKREGLDRLLAGRLLALDARSRGMDNTGEFRDIIRQNEQSVLVNALLRKELDAKLKPDEKEIQAEAAKLKEGNKGMSDNDALSGARRSVTERLVRKIEEEIVAAARDKVKPVVDQAMVDRVVKGEKVGDNAVLATAGDGRVLLGDVRKVFQAAGGGEAHGQQDFTRNPSAMASVVNREMMGKALVAYAKSQGIEGSEAYRDTRRDMERSVVISMAAERAIPKDLAVTDPEIKAAYAEHAEMFAREGKKIPLEAVKEQIRLFLQNEKRRKALDSYIAELRKKAKITVNEALLPKV